MNHHVAVIGLGYIGLPTAAILATHGLQVTGVDVNEDTVQAVNSGNVPFVEPDLEAHVAGATKQGRLHATQDMPKADSYIVAVPTPFREGNAPDLSYVLSAAAAIAPQLQGGELIVLESTSPPGATKEMAQAILERRTDLTLESGHANSVYFAHCPERVLPGRVMIELVTNDRVIGELNTGAAEMARTLYATFCQGEILLTDAMTAEATKLVENAFRDVNIAFANELSVVAANLGIDVWELIRLANHHPRVNILSPGPGVGGHCIAVDPWFLISAAPNAAPLMTSARMVNDAKPEFVVQQVLAAAKDFESPRIAALGLAFKANIDDLRQSPAMQITQEVAARLSDAHIDVVEPHVALLPPQLSALDNVRLRELHSAIADADIVLALVDHDETKNMPVELLSGKVLIDTRGVWRHQFRDQRS